MTEIKTTHVGSLPRPQEMIAKVLRKQQVTADDLQQYVTAVIEKQLDLGISYINNGEIPRMDYVQSTVSRISGFGGSATAPIQAGEKRPFTRSRRARAARAGGRTRSAPKDRTASAVRPRKPGP